VNRKWYTLPLSLLMHAALVALLIVVPLVVADALPAPRKLLNFVIADVPPVPAPASPAPRRIQPTDISNPNPDAAPLEAPTGVHRESALEVTHEPIAGGIEGVIEGLDTQLITPDVLPLNREPVAEPVRLSAGIKLPTRIKDVPPVYPEIARKAPGAGRGDSRSHHRHRRQGAAGACTAFSPSPRSSRIKRRAVVGVHTNIAERAAGADHHDGDGAISIGITRLRKKAAITKLAANLLKLQTRAKRANCDDKASTSGI
jgi:hypothetical protein